MTTLPLARMLVLLSALWCGAARADACAAWLTADDDTTRLIYVKSEQVLDPAHFATIQPGQSAEEVRMRIGRPAHIFTVGWQSLWVWNYRWWQGDCVWYQVSIAQESNLVVDAGYGTDPACDGPNRVAGMKGR